MALHFMQSDVDYPCEPQIGRPRIVYVHYRLTSDDNETTTAYILHGTFAELIKLSASPYLCDNMRIAVNDSCEAAARGVFGSSHIQDSVGICQGPSHQDAWEAASITLTDPDHMFQLSPNTSLIQSGSPSFRQANEGGNLAASVGDNRIQKRHHMRFVYAGDTEVI
ncbi:uncharacterized protein ARMOST_14648 [Armillaria ostoyae]|uniref:Uncharacterized protein n=1 Tax=Armillaria ostoyae TaxID=47428 RepID=A0A284RRC4_ARMOS|nr:uncharacterized protein ARMOST_14648 [Armillaria ostoyae]